MKINFSKVIVKDIEGNSIKEIEKFIGNLIYQKTNDIAVLELATKIYKGEEIELSQIQVQEIKRIINENAFAFVKKPLLEYIDKV